MAVLTGMNSLSTICCSLIAISELFLNILLVTGVPVMFPLFQPNEYMILRVYARL